MQKQVRPALGALLAIAILGAGSVIAGTSPHESEPSESQPGRSIPAAVRVAQDATLRQCSDQCSEVYQTCLQQAAESKAQKDQCFSAWARCNQGCNAYRR